MQVKLIYLYFTEPKILVDLYLFFILVYELQSGQSILPNMFCLILPYHFPGQDG